MTKSLEKLYNTYNYERIGENPLASIKAREMFDTFLDTFFDKENLKEYNSAWEMLVDVCENVKADSFEFGFYTAVELLTGK